MAIRIVTDSSSDISQEEALKKNITVIPLNLECDGKTYQDEIDITKDKFYELLTKEKKSFKTASPAPAIFEEIFEDAKKNNDDVIVLLLGSALSGTRNVAMMVKDMVEYDNIYIPDTRSVIGGLQILVNEAIKMKDNGMAAADIVAEIESLKKRVRVWGAMNSLDYLRRGGRLKFMEALIGNMLLLKPIISFEPDGKIYIAKKPIGMTRSMKTVIELLNDHPIDTTREVIYYYSLNQDNLVKFKGMLEKEGKLLPGNDVNLSPVVGCHIGDNCVAICYIEKE